MDARITSVEDRILGSALVLDTSIGAGTIQVSDGTEFDESGTIQLGAEIMPYSDVNEETGIITLSGTLASTHTADDPVYVYPLSQERLAYLAEGDNPQDEEGMIARIPHALWDKIPVGIRNLDGGEGETVQADFVSDELVIFELVGQDPVVDGSFIDPVTLPPNPSDGNPPSTSPTPTVAPGIGTLFVTWTPITNADGVEYEVHVSVTTGFSPTGGSPGVGTCYAVVEGGFCTIKTDPATAAPLIYDTPYFVKIIARDVDGSASASAQGTGTPIKANTPDIAVNAITADQIAANQITAGKLESELVLASTIETAASGRRVEISPDGIALFASDESTLVNIPTDPLKDVSFAGQVDAAAMSVGPGDASITGSGGLQIEPDSQLHLVGGQSNPSLSPVVSGAYPSVSYAVDAAAGTAIGVRVSHYSASGGAGGATPCFYGTLDYQDGGGSTYSCYAVEWLASTGAVNRSHSIAVGISGSGKRTGLGAVMIGGNIYSLFYNLGSNIYQMRSFDLATFGVLGTVSFGAPSSTLVLETGNVPNVALAANSSNPIVFSYDTATNRPNRATVTITTPSAPTLGAATSFSAGSVKFNSYGDAANFSGSWGPQYITGAAWDGTNWYVQYRWASSGSGTGTFLQMYVQSTGNVLAKKEIYTPDSLVIGASGMYYDGTDYHLFSSTSSRKHSTFKTTYTWDYTLGSVLYVGYTWDDGTHHTAVSTIGQLSFASGISQAPMMGMTVTVTMPTIPALVTKNLLYVLFASSLPAANTLKLQAATTYASTDTLPTVTHKAFNASGAVNPDSNGNTFPAGGAPAFMSGDATGATASWKMDSSGLFVIPRYTVAQRPGSPAEATVLYDEDMGGPAFYGDSFGAGAWAPDASRLAIARRSYEYHSDLMGSATQLGEFQSFANLGGTVTDDPGEAKHPGLIHLATGTTSNATGNSGLRLGNSGSNQPIVMGNGVVRCACLVRFGTITTPFYYFRFGVTDTNMASDPTVGFSFRWNANVNSAKAQRAIAGTFTDTGITALVASTWYLFEIVVNAAATSAEFFINGVSGGTSSGSAQTGAVVLAAGIVKDTSTTTSRVAVIDYLGVAGEFSSARF